MIHNGCDCTVKLALLAFLAWNLGCKPSGPTPPPQDGNSTAAVGSQSSTTPTAAVLRHARPEETVTAFLEALRAGDDQRATSLLTAQAQQEMERANAAIKPPGSPSAEFKVTEVAYVDEAKDGAHVLSSWTDVAADGTRESYEIIWILRQESGGWAIAGMATKVFDDQEPLILNFEDPLDAQQKRQAVDQELARRQQTPATAAQQPVQQARQPVSSDAASQR